VFAVTHELFYLQQYIRDQLSPERAGIFADRARFRSDITLGLSPAEQLKVKSPCPFLDDGACQVYPARPMACRIYLSSSAAECRKEFEDPRNEAIIPPLFEFPLRAGRMLNEGFVAYLRERGLPVSELPLEQAYKSMISLELTAEKWISKARD
jgi:Fe-S-cluster containining protein